MTLAFAQNECIGYMFPCMLEFLQVAQTKRLHKSHCKQRWANPFVKHDQDKQMCFVFDHEAHPLTGDGVLNSATEDRPEICSDGTATIPKKGQKQMPDQLCLAVMSQHGSNEFAVVAGFWSSDDSHAASQSLLHYWTAELSPMVCHSTQAVQSRLPGATTTSWGKCRCCRQRMLQYLEFGAVMTAMMRVSASCAICWKSCGRCCATVPRPYRADCLMLASLLLHPSKSKGRICAAYLLAPAQPQLLVNTCMKELALVLSAGRAVGGGVP